MKKLLLIRHAKSSWDTSVPNDFDRALNDRGNRDAPVMARRLQKRDLKIDAFVTSPAKRAFTTAAVFSAEFNVKEKHIISIPALYEPKVEDFFNVAGQLAVDLKTVCIFSHNPSITEFVNQLTQVNIDNMPTCGIFAVKCDVEDWTAFRNAEKEFWFFDYPKLLT